MAGDRKSTRLNSSHLVISYAVFCLKKKKEPQSCATWEEKRLARPASFCLTSATVWSPANAVSVTPYVVRSMLICPQRIGSDIDHNKHVSHNVIIEHYHNEHMKRTLQGNQNKRYNATFGT